MIIRWFVPLVLAASLSAQGTQFISDMTLTAESNAWGPIEKDKSNGENGAGDGTTISLNGTTFAKGLGMHAAASVSVAINGQYRSFAATVGIDDEVPSAGSVIFQVYGDGALLAQSPVMTGTSANYVFNVPVPLVSVLRLAATDAGDGNGQDHASWGGARVIPLGKLTSSRTSYLENKHALRARAVALGDGMAPHIKVVDMNDDWWFFSMGSNPSYASWANTNLDVLEGFGVGTAAGAMAPYTAGKKIAYFDAYSITNTGHPSSAGTPSPNQPGSILKDAGGNNLYLAYNCGPTVCTQYAADVGLQAWRDYWIAQAGTLLAAGYHGIFIDDVNLTLGAVVNGTGTPVAPIDPRTGIAMTETNWRMYFRTFLQQVRAAYPTAFIVHNALWANGINEVGWPGHDANINAAHAAATVVDKEQGVEDINSGGPGGQFNYSLESFMMYIDSVHAQGSGFYLCGTSRTLTDAQREYALAFWYLTMTSYTRDFIGERGESPSQFWSGYNTRLGTPVGLRTEVTPGLWRRNFTGGYVLVNEPEAGTQTNYPLGGTYTRAGSATPITTVTLTAKQGAVLINPVAFRSTGPDKPVRSK